MLLVSSLAVGSPRMVGEGLLVVLHSFSEQCVRWWLLCCDAATSLHSNCVYDYPVHLLLNDTHIMMVGYILTEIQCVNIS